MAKKAKAKKTTTTTAKKKETASKPKVQEEKQPDQIVDAPPQPDVPRDAAELKTQDEKQPEQVMETQPQLDVPGVAAEPKVQEEERSDQIVDAPPQPDVPRDAAELASPDPKSLDVPTPAPSLAMTTRKPAPVPVAVPESPQEPPAEAPSEPVASEPPPTGVLAILNVKTKEDAGVTEGNLSTYRDYIEKNLERPVRVCGREPFGWERPYAWGLRDSGEYGKRKEKCPSYVDVLEIVGFDEGMDLIEGIAVRVSRPADGKEFTLLLGSLKSEDAASKNAEVLDDFAKWFTEDR
jgi:hypothetical protein